MLVPVGWFTVKCQCFGIRCNIAERLGSQNCIVIFFRCMNRCDVFNMIMFLLLWLEWLENKYIKLMSCPCQSPVVLWIERRNEKPNSRVWIQVFFIQLRASILANGINPPPSPSYGLNSRNCIWKKKSFEFSKKLVMQYVFGKKKRTVLKCKIYFSYK